MTDIPPSIGARIAPTTTPQTGDGPKIGQSRERALATVQNHPTGVFGGDGPVNVATGGADNPPNAGGNNRTVAQKVGAFFSAIGSGIASGFRAVGSAIASGASAIGNFFASIGRGNADADGGVQAPPDPRGPKPPRADSPAYLNTAGGFLARGVEEGGLEGAKAAINNLLDTAAVQMWEQQSGPQEITEFVAAKFDPQGKDGFAMTPTTFAKLEGHMDALRDHFADNPGALAILDQLNGYDFDATMQQEFGAIVDKLTLGGNPLGSFMRGNSFVSAALKTLSGEAGFSPSEFGNGLIAANTGALDGLRQEFGQMEKFDRGKERLTGDMATGMMEGVATYLDQLISTEGEGSIQNRFGEEFLGRLEGMAQQIASREDIPADVRNGAIEKLYIDQLFLRGGVTAMTLAADKESPEYVAAQLVQSAVNGVSGEKFDPEMRQAYQEGTAGFQDRFHAALVTVGMPVVAE